MGDLTLSDYNQIVNVVHKIGGIDLSNYATSSLRRRFQTFFINNNIENLDQLLGNLQHKEGYLDKFLKALTVNTTEMFRDPSFWELLKTDILPKYSNYERLRIWHAACSTGEEVFSMAILLKELGMLDRTKIIATDINTHVLEVARSRTYSGRNQKLNNANYENAGGEGSLEDYYTENEKQVVFSEELIQNVEFVEHNLAQDDKLANFDIIICRNVMIYFNTILQERVVKLFSESLCLGGYMGIGSKESIVWCKSARNLSAISITENIYKKVAD